MKKFSQSVCFFYYYYFSGEKCWIFEINVSKNRKEDKKYWNFASAFMTDLFNGW